MSHSTEGTRTPGAGDFSGARGLPHNRPAAGKDLGILKFAFMLLVCLAVMLGVVRPYVTEVFFIPSGSMTPTLQAGDHVVVNKLAYRFAGPERGDLLAFKSAEKGGQITIKRVIGLPGDTVALKDGQLLIDQKPVEEPYVNRRIPDTSFYGPAPVPEGHFFVMGDNRPRSVDSRFLGPVPQEDIAGRVVLRLWPPGRVELF